LNDLCRAGFPRHHKKGGETPPLQIGIFGCMKTDRIRINKTPAQPEGIEVELVKPENTTEGDLLAFLMSGYIRDMKQQGRLPYELPERFGVRHQADGSFILSGYYDESRFYEPPQPLVILGIQVRQGKFNLIHAAIQARARGEQQVAMPAQQVSEVTSTADAPPADLPRPPADEHTAT
jgi:hypothetical protein